MVIREALPPDAAEISDLSTQLGYPIKEEEINSHLTDLLADPDHNIFVAENLDIGLVGFVHVFVTKRLFLDSFIELGGLVVDGGNRGEGHGMLLLAAAEAWAAEKGCREMRIRSNVIREAAHNFYLNQGYLAHKKQTVFLKRIP